MTTFRFLFSAHWATLVLAMLTGLMSGASSAGLIALTNHVLTTNNFLSFPLMGGFIGLCLLSLVSYVATQILLSRLTQKITYELRIFLTKQILSLPLSEIEQLGNAKLLTALIEDVQVLSNLLLVVAQLSVNIAIMLSCLVYMFWLSPALFGVSFVFIALGVTSYQLLIKPADSYLYQARDHQTELFGHLRGTLDGIKELKLHQYRQQAFLKEELESSAQAVRQTSIDGFDRLAIANGWGRLLFFLAIGLFLFGLPRLITLEPSVLSGYILVTLYLAAPLEGILNSLPFLLRTKVALSQLQELGLLSKSADNDKDHPLVLGSLDKINSLEMTGVVHSYQHRGDGNNFVVGPVDLILRSGEITFLVGGNGSGKTTLAKLITGLYAPEQGEVHLDGKLILNHNLEWYRQHVSAVFSDFYLFKSLLGLDSERLSERAQDYLHQLQLDHKVQIVNHRFSTTDLSQGQRKRLALLVAYLEDRPLYLFDEWAADQDPLFKEIFYKRILPDLKDRGKTIIVISHDDRYFHLADQILRLESGEIAPI
jgi:putative pyoverdin transport system ATP-binding/permease protein